MMGGGGICNNTKSRESVLNKFQSSTVQYAVKYTLHANQKKKKPKFVFSLHNNNDSNIDRIGIEDGR